MWDVTNNSATATTHFVVASSEAVALERVLAYPNPATDRVTFRMTGNQACRQAQVKLDVFSVSGALMYEQTLRAKSWASRTTSCLGICVRLEGLLWFPGCTSSG